MIKHWDVQHALVQRHAAATFGNEDQPHSP